MSAKAESPRSSLKEPEGSIREYFPLITKSMERAAEMGIQYGFASAEATPPIWNPVF